MSRDIRVPWMAESHIYADTVLETDRPTHSRLLGPDGRPLPYEQPRPGFDLKPQPKGETS